MSNSEKPTSARFNDNHATSIGSQGEKAWGGKLLAGSRHPSHTRDFIGVASVRMAEENRGRAIGGIPGCPIQSEAQKLTRSTIAAILDDDDVLRHSTGQGLLPQR